MSMKTINEFVEEVLNFHPSRSTSKLLLPKVLLKRLTNKTIQEYTGMKNRLESCNSPESFCDFTYDSVPVLEDESSISKDRQEDNLDSTSTSSSDDLPNLNDPSWERRVKKESKKKKKIDIYKSDTKLMANARKLFKQEANRYRSSQDFVKFSKYSEVKNSKMRSKLGYTLPNTELQSLSNNKTSSSDVEVATVQTTEEADDADGESNPSWSVAEVMIMKSRKAMSKCVGLDDVIDSEEQLENTCRTVSDTIDLIESTISSDSNDSNRTDIFDDHIEDIYPMESVTSLSTDDIHVLTFPHEKNSKKRKGSFSKTEESPETNKKSKQEDEPSMGKQTDANKKPMVIIPTSVSTSVTSPSKIVTTFIPAAVTTTPAIATSTIEGVVVSIPALESISTPSSSNVTGQISSQLERISATTASNKYHENGQNDATNTKEKGSVSSSEKSFTPFNKFQELTLRRIECVEKIRQIKEEYDSKLQPLEKELKSLDDEVQKLMISTTKWENLSKEEHHSASDERQVPVGGNSSDVEEIANPMCNNRTSPEQLKNTSLTPATTSSIESQTMEKRFINIIPDASIRNFGVEKIPDNEVLKNTSSQPQPTLNTTEGAVSGPHLQKKQYRRIALRPVVTSMPSTASVQYSSLDKQPPPNAVLSVQQQSASMKIIPRLVQVEQTNVMMSQNQQSQVRQNNQYLPIQVQQQQQMNQQQQPQLIQAFNDPRQQQQTHLQHSSNSYLAQQQPSISQPYVHQYQSTQGQHQHNMQPLQGHVVVSSNNRSCSTTQMTTVPSNTIIAPFQQNALTHNTNTNIQTQSYNLGSNHPSNFAQTSNSLNPVTGNKNISLTLPSVSPSTPITRVSGNNMIIPTQSNTSDSLLIKDANQSVEESLAASLSNTSDAAGSSLQQIESSRPICARCGLDGSYLCCNGVVYCSKTCQGNDWKNHQLKCTNSQKQNL